LHDEHRGEVTRIRAARGRSAREGAVGSPERECTAVGGGPLGGPAATASSRRAWKLAC